MSKDNVCLDTFYQKCNIDFHNFCYEYNEEEIIQNVVKIEVWAKDEQEKEYTINHLHGFAYEIHPDNHSMEIYADDVSKATGIHDVLKLLNISVEDSYCFGDGPYDVEMFDAVAHPIAMGNAIDIIKEKAESVCLSVDEDGVAYALKEMFGVEL